MKSPTSKALMLALLILFADQLHKWIMLELFHIAIRPPMEITSFFKLVMVWNTGVSFGMLTGHGAENHWPLTLVTSALTLGVLIWLWRAPDAYTKCTLALIAGGAIGNIIDRIRFGAVADFFYFHVSSFAWPAFNVADAAICIGVVLLVGQGILSPAKKGESE